MEDIVEAYLFLYDFDIVVRTMIEELVRRSVGKNANTVLLLLHVTDICYVSNIEFIFYLSLKPIVVHLAMNSLKELQTWSDIRLLAKKELNMFFQRTCVNCKKHYLTN